MAMVQLLALIKHTSNKPSAVGNWSIEGAGNLCENDLLYLIPKSTFLNESSPKVISYMSHFQR